MCLQTSELLSIGKIEGKKERLTKGIIKGKMGQWENG